MIPRALVLVTLCFYATSILIAQTELPKEFERLKNEQQIITQCQQALSSDDEQQRLSAVLVLGRYKTNGQAQQLLIKQLQDSSKLVRRAALTSLTEMGKLPFQLQAKILPMINDEDPEVRRLASLFFFAAYYRLPTGQRPSDAELTAMLSKALATGDPVVLKQLYKQYFQLSTLTEAQLLVPHLKHEDEEIRILTAKTLLNYGQLYLQNKRQLTRLEANRERYINQNQPIPNSTLELLQQNRKKVKNLETAILQLPQIMAMEVPALKHYFLDRLFYGEHPVVISTLEQLKSDADPAIALLAHMASWSEQDPKATKQILKLAKEGQFSAEVQTQFCRWIPNSNAGLALQSALIGLVPDDFKTTLLTHGHPQLIKQLKNEQLLTWLESDYAPLFEQTTRIINRKHLPSGLFNEAVFEKLLADESAQRLTSLSPLIPSMTDQQTDYYLDSLLFCEDEEARILGLTLYTQLQRPGWQNIIKNAREDESSAVRQAAKRLLPNASF